MTVACVKLKITLPNIVIRGGSGTSAVSKIELFVAKALLWKPFNFCCRELEYIQALAWNLDPLVKYDFTITVWRAIQ